MSKSTQPVILRCSATKANGLSANGYWYVAQTYEDCSFTITLNRNKAKVFQDEASALEFNANQVKLGHIFKPFEFVKV